jgi:integrase
MAGSMRQRSPGSWQLRVYAGLDDRGKSRYIQRTIKGGKRTAQRAMREIETAIENGEHHADRGEQLASTTVGELLDRWLLQGDWSPSTRTGHVQCVNGWIRPHLGDVRLDRLSLWKIEGFYRTLSVSGGDGGKPLSAASVKRTHTVMHAALSEGVRWGMLATNPATGARRPKGEAFEAEVPDLDGVRRALDAAPERLRIVIALAISTGARRGELMALKWDDVDERASTISISRSITLGGAIKTTKTKATGVVSVGPETMEMLSVWRAAQNERWTELRPGPMPEDMWVFPAFGWERPLGPDTISQQWRVLADSVGLEGVRFHDLRHATATHLVSNGVDVRTVSGRLRHASTSMTLDVYAAKVTDSDVAAGKLLDGLVYGTDENEK